VGGSHYRTAVQGRSGERPPETFDFEGFAIPDDLAILTGGGEETWLAISLAHMAQYSRYSPIHPGQNVLEIGCGVGRDAIPLIKLLGPDGSYVGVDIIERSISWCRDNIAERYRNATFAHLDVASPFYNPSGRLSGLEVRLPGQDGQFDRIILQSVFTHMFRDEIVHYLSEFRRLLRDDGVVFATFFVADKDSRRLAVESGAELRFERRRGRGCRIADPKNPEGAVGYTSKALGRMLKRGGMVLEQPIHLGFWSGRRETPDGQDVAILKKRATA
jgi:SAM-dependent methyltransferase